ncbi:MAG: efflux RND transporter periplasmic adaptor subunit [Hyphomicrobiaceae bacterium]
MKKSILTLILTLTLFGLAAAATWLAKPDLVHQALARIQASPPDRTAATGTKPSSAADAGRAGGKTGGQSGSGGRATVVETAAARSLRASIDIEAVGSLRSDESVRIAPEIAGRISEIVFEEGKPVRKGDILVKLDDSLARAELAQAQARLDLAAANNERARALSRSGNVTERSRDEAVSTFQTARAERELAETRLAKHVLLAPFDGIVGVRGVSTGAFVAVGTEIVNLEKIDALKVDFKVPEVHLRDVRVGQPFTLLVDAYPTRTFEGEVYASDPMVDVNGRALSVRGRIANRDGLLRPGLFARIRLKGLTASEVVQVPEAAVLPRGGESFLFTVEGDGTARERRVRLGTRRDGEVEILDGLTLPAIIVVAGQQRLRTGDRVEVLPSSVPPPEPSSNGTPGLGDAALGGSG